MKMNHPFLSFCVVLMVITAIMGVGCKNNDNPRKYDVMGVTLNKSEITLELIGDTEQLFATIEPAKATNKGVSWTSSHTNVAEVNNDGLVTAKGEGESTITVTTDDWGCQASCQVTVPKQPPVIIPVTGISLDVTDAMLYAGGTLQLNATIEPDHATNKQVKWSSSEYNVANVNFSGLVTASDFGETTITVTTVDGSYTATCKVKVEIPVAAVSFRMGKVEMILGETQMLTATVFPLNAGNRNVSWSSTNEAVAIVDGEGMVTSKSIGESVITVTTENGEKMATVTVKVSPAPPVSQFVKTYGSKFVVNGKEVIFIGAGHWPTANWNAATYSKLASIGFNSLRLYINASNATIDNPTNVTPSLSNIDNHIALAKQNNMKIILNVHHSPGSGGQISDRGFFTNQDRQERLAAFWKAIAERYKDEPTIVGFDIINEPTVRVVNAGGHNVNYNCVGTPYINYFEDYRKIIQNIVNAIREVNTNHIIIAERLWIDPGCDSNAPCWWFGLNDQRDCWQDYDGKFNFPDIYDSAGNYAYTYHCYEPNTYCHQTGRNARYPSGAIARNNEGPNGVQPWLYCKEYLDYAYTVPMRYIREVKNVPVYIGEMGQLPYNYDNNRGGQQWMEDVYDIMLNRYKLSNSFHPYNISEFHPNFNVDHETAFRKAFGTN